MNVMSMSQDQVFETALSLPLQQRADLAFQLLQSFDFPGEEIDADMFGAELRERVEAYRRGEIGSSSLEEARAIIQQRLSAGHTK
jgi:putative addiction module component (TIGR02574 family)